MISKLFRLLLLCLLLPLTVKAASFNSIIVFGDSLSDNGNLAALPSYQFLNKSPYQHGFANSSMAVEQLATELGLTMTPSLYLTGKVVGNNFAVAGARASGNNSIDLSSQVKAFLASQSGKASADNLYIIFIGGNDLRDIRDQPDEKVAAKIMTNAIKSINTQVRQLITAGATRILVVGAANIATVPESLAIAASKTNPATFVNRATQKSLEFNRKLTQSIALIEKQTTIDIVTFDLSTFINFFISNNRAFNINNTKSACFSSVTFNYYHDCKDGNLTDEFLFFDEIHPNKIIHERLARALFAIIPIPPTVVTDQKI